MPPLQFRVAARLAHLLLPAPHRRYDWLTAESVTKSKYTSMYWVLTPRRLFVEESVHVCTCACVCARFRYLCVPYLCGPVLQLQTNFVLYGQFVYPCVLAEKNEANCAATYCVSTSSVGGDVVMLLQDRSPSVRANSRASPQQEVQSDPRSRTFSWAIEYMNPRQ
eukprot:4646926-Amphidinium_carterae.1